MANVVGYCESCERADGDAHKSSSPNRSQAEVFFFDDCIE